MFEMSAVSEATPELRIVQLRSLSSAVSSATQFLSKSVRKQKTIKQISVSSEQKEQLISVVITAVIPTRFSSERYDCISIICT
jgi:hypothetical protein